MEAVLLDAGGPQTPLFHQIAEKAGNGRGERDRMLTPASPDKARNSDTEHLLDRASQVLCQRRAGAAIGPQACPLGHPMGDEGVDVDRQVRQVFSTAIASELSEGHQHRNPRVDHRN